MQNISLNYDRYVCGACFAYRTSRTYPCFSCSMHEILHYSRQCVVAYHAVLRLRFAALRLWRARSSPRIAESLIDFPAILPCLDNHPPPAFFELSKLVELRLGRFVHTEDRLAIVWREKLAERLEQCHTLCLSLHVLGSIFGADNTSILHSKKQES